MARSEWCENYPAPRETGPGSGHSLSYREPAAAGVVAPLGRSLLPREQGYHTAPGWGQGESVGSCAKAGVERFPRWVGYSRLAPCPRERVMGTEKGPEVHAQRCLEGPRSSALGWEGKDGPPVCSDFLTGASLGTGLCGMGRNCVSGTRSSTCQSAGVVITLGRSLEDKGGEAETSRTGLTTCACLRQGLVLWPLGSSWAL